MRLEELLEVRGSTLEYFIKRYPNIPEYVVRDFLYKNYKDNPKSFDDETGMWLNDLNWKKEILTVTLDIFDDETQDLLKQRMGGKKFDFVHNDTERHETQLALLKKKGPSKEPIIVTKQAGFSYELQEGWHRTVQSLLLWPEGYKQVAWIGEE